MKSIFIDLLNGLTYSDILFISLQLFGAMFLGLTYRMVVKLAKQENIPTATIACLIPVALCFLVLVSKNSAPLSISVLGIFILSGKLKISSSVSDFKNIFLLGIIGFGCGSGFVILTYAVFFLIVFPISYVLK